jgi:hypothetical protein
MTAPRAWLPPDWVHPERVELPTGHHLRPIREDDIDLDFPAVMGSRDHLWAIFGAPWGWPPADLTYEDDRDELARHEREIVAHESFNYAVLDADESHLLGCVYVDPAERAGADADISWWVVVDMVATPLDAALTEVVPHWIRTAWPFARPRFVGDGLDLTWTEWLRLPAVGDTTRE